MEVYSCLIKKSCLWVPKIYILLLSNCRSRSVVGHYHGHQRGLEWGKIVFLFRGFLSRRHVLNFHCPACYISTWGSRKKLISNLTLVLQGSRNLIPSHEQKKKVLEFDLVKVPLWSMLLINIHDLEKPFAFKKRTLLFDSVISLM